MIVLLTMVVFALIGAAVGYILSRNGITPYGLGQQYGRHYMKDQGLEEEETVDSWNKQ
ncbi:MAG: hypothetical protein IJI44_06085 [Erysipelotrichaceae bacterium]|nr:hypothetical protein [Erysipelotrichaceae bacterium]